MTHRDEEDPLDTPSRGDEFRRPDGTIEIVYETAGGRVLTLREYPTVDAFREAARDAEYRGENAGVRDLSDVDSFSEG